MNSRPETHCEDFYNIHKTEPRGFISNTEDLAQQRRCQKSWIRMKSSLIKMYVDRIAELNNKQSSLSTEERVKIGKM